MNPTLKPCPFCGNPETISTLVENFQVRVVCYACGATGPGVLREQSGWAEKAEAVWNCRDDEALRIRRWDMNILRLFPHPKNDWGQACIGGKHYIFHPEPFIQYFERFKSSPTP